jgi:hypothetical protein
MNNIYYLIDDDEWIKLKYRGDLSALDDVFEFMEDIFYNIDGVKRLRAKVGDPVSMYYGTMNTLIEKGELLTEEEYLNLVKDGKE